MLIFTCLRRVTVAVPLFADRVLMLPTPWSGSLHGPIRHVAPMSIQQSTPEEHSSEIGSPRTAEAAFN